MKKSIAYLLLLTLVSCQTPKETTTYADNANFLDQSLTWTQQSAEFRALCFQSYNWAEIRLAEKLKNRSGSKKPAVILDIDETILDNSPYTAWCILNNQTYTQATWKAWTDRAEADTIAGAAKFLHWADQNGVQLFFVSNRRVEELTPTIKNMQKFGLPQLEESHFLLRDQESNKEKRRQQVLENHEVLLLIGDNLNDFAEVFEEQLRDARFEQTNQAQSKFGIDFIVLPNAMYGSWEAAIYGYTVRLNEVQKDSVRKALMIVY